MRSWSVEQIRELATKLSLRTAPSPAHVSPETLTLIVRALRAFADQAEARLEAPDTFAIDLWNNEGSVSLERLSTATNITIAKAAFRAAVVCRGDYRLTLRSGALMIEEHQPFRKER